MIVEGMFQPKALGPDEKGVKLKSAFFYSQKNNQNPDGTSNMSPKGTNSQKLWGRFNHCFISTTTAVYNQKIASFLSQGLPPKTKGVPFLKESDVLLALSFPNKQLWPKPNRYLWDNHRQLFEVCFKVAYPQIRFSISFEQALDGWEKKVMESLKNGFQCYISFKSPDHVLSAIGMTDKGLYVCDPAGDIRKGYHDIANTDGRDIFYGWDIIDKYVTNLSHIMIFKLED